MVDPVIPPSAMAYYDGDMFAEWDGAFLWVWLVAQSAVVGHMNNDCVAGEERVDVGASVRGVSIAPDGSVTRLRNAAVQACEFCS